MFIGEWFVSSKRDLIPASLTIVPERSGGRNASTGERYMTNSRKHNIGEHFCKESRCPDRLAYVVVGKENSRHGETEGGVKRRGGESEKGKGKGRNQGRGLDGKG